MDLVDMFPVGPWEQEAVRATGCCQVSIATVVCLDCILVARLELYAALHVAMPQEQLCHFTALDITIVQPVPARTLQQTIEHDSSIGVTSQASTELKSVLSCSSIILCARYTLS